MAEITKIKDDSYMVHYRSGHTEQYKLHGEQTNIGSRIYNIRRIRGREDLTQRSRNQAAYSKEETRAKAIKAIVLFLMTNPEKFSGKSKLITALKKFADSKGIQVSEKKFRSLYFLYSGLAA